MGRQAFSNAGRAVNYEIDKAMPTEATFEHESGAGLVDGDGDRVEKLGFSHVWWPNVVSTLNYYANAYAGRQWSNMTEKEKGMWNEVRRAERAAWNRYDRRQESINAFSRQHQEQGCDTMLAYDRAVESRYALDYERFSLLAKKYAAFIDCVSLQAIRKRITRNPDMKSHIDHVFIEDGRKAGIFMEHPMRYGSMAQHLVDTWSDQSWPLEPLESLVKSKRSDDLRRIWLAYHTDEFFEQGNLWPAHCLMSPEEGERIAEIAKILEAAGVEIGPEGVGQVWGC